MKKISLNYSEKKTKRQKYCFIFSKYKFEIFNFFLLNQKKKREIICESLFITLYHRVRKNLKDAILQ